jgi:hypothetical protein
MAMISTTAGLMAIWCLCGPNFLRLNQTSANGTNGVWCACIHRSHKIFVADHSGGGGYAIEMMPIIVRIDQTKESQNEAWAIASQTLTARTFQLYVEALH